MKIKKQITIVALAVMIFSASFPLMIACDYEDLDYCLDVADRRYVRCVDRGDEEMACYIAWADDVDHCYDVYCG